MDRSPSGATLTCRACGTSYDAHAVDVADAVPPFGDGCRECWSMERCIVCGQERSLDEFEDELRCVFCAAPDQPGA